MLTIHKHPIFENDDMLIEIKNFSLQTDELSKIFIDSPYTKLKFDKFKNKDVSIDGFSTFSNERPSLRNINPDTLLVGSIYTHSVGDRNNVTYNESLEIVKKIITKNPKSRKAVIRMANSIEEYCDGEFLLKDVSCLNLIQYYNGDVRLVFRASDIKNELFTDLVTIYWFFIKPIFDKCNITIYASTAQNIEFIDNLECKLNNMDYNNK